MRKRDEMTDPASCLSRAGDDEMIFVLLGRDEDAPGAVRDWIARRIERGKNRPDDEKMIEAERCARIMEAERATAVTGRLRRCSPGPEIVALTHDLDL